MKLYPYKVTFLVTDGKEEFLETVSIKASDEAAAQTGAFKTKIMPKFKGEGYRYIVVETEKCTK